MNACLNFYALHKFNFINYIYLKIVKLGIVAKGLVFRSVLELNSLQKARHLVCVLVSRELGPFW